MFWKSRFLLISRRKLNGISEKNPNLVIECATRQFIKQPYSVYLPVEKTQGICMFCCYPFCWLSFSISFWLLILHVLQGICKVKDPRDYQYCIRTINKKLPNRDKTQQLHPSQPGKPHETERENIKEMQSIEGNNHTKQISFNPTLTLYSTNTVQS